MSYTGATVIDSATAQHEIDLLQQGFSYKAVAAITGTKLATLKERNRLVYHVDIYRVFRERIQRDGIPNQLRISDEFGYYFVGLFDGEGSIVAWHRIRTRGKPYAEFRLGLQIMLRDDDADVLHYVHEHLGGGLLAGHHNTGPTNPTLVWKLEDIKQLAEQMVPLFDRYPLRSKKQREYQVWRPLVIERYLATLGGETARGGPSDAEP